MREGPGLHQLKIATAGDGELEECAARLSGASRSVLEKELLYMLKELRLQAFLQEGLRDEITDYAVRLTISRKSR